MIYMIMLLGILSAFCWAIGGEKYFGKWRRSALMVLPFCLKAWTFGAEWWTYVAIVANFYTYQAFFYDDCIKMIYPDPNAKKRTTLQKVLGWLGCFANGMIAAVFPLVLYASMGYVAHGLVTLLIGGLGFCLAVWLSNGLKFTLPLGDIRIGEVKIWCPQDSWWLACFILGLIIGLS